MELKKIKKILKGCGANQILQVFCNDTVGLCKDCSKDLEKHMRKELNKITINKEKAKQ